MAMIIRSCVPSPPSIIGTCAGGLPIPTTNNISKGAAFPLQGMLLADSMAKDAR